MDLSAIITPTSDPLTKSNSTFPPAMDWMSSYTHDTPSQSGDSASDTKSDTSGEHETGKLSPMSSSDWFGGSRTKIFKFHLERHYALRQQPAHLPPKKDTHSRGLFHGTPQPTTKSQRPCRSRTPEAEDRSRPLSSPHRRKSSPIRSLDPDTENTFRFDFGLQQMIDLAIGSRKRSLSSDATPSKPSLEKYTLTQPCPANLPPKKKRAVMPPSPSLHPAAVAADPLQAPPTTVPTDPPPLTSPPPAMPTSTTPSGQPPSKKSLTDAAMAYDNVNLDIPDEAFFDPLWKPSMGVFSRKPGVRVLWKGSPLNVTQMPYYSSLHPGEVNIASTLRLTPEQFIRCKRTLILAAQDFRAKGMPFRKSDAQKLCRIDVNKVSTLWSVFGRLGWLSPNQPH